MAFNNDLSFPEQPAALQRLARVSTASIAGSLIAALLLVLVLAESPELHHLIHADAHHADHDCAVTLFLTGSFDQPAPAILIPLPLPEETLVSFARAICEQFVSSRFRRQDLARGPPQA